MGTGPARLIIFTRYPEAGRAKTRLIPALGPAGAAAVHRRLAEAMVGRARAFVAARPEVELEVRFAGGEPARMAGWLGRDLTLRPQSAGDLGVRMQDAFAAAWSEGAEAAVLTGTDAPGLDAAILDAAFAALGRADAVLGPATDGGYYLIGLRGPAPRLFRDMPWSTDRVAALTLERARRAGLATETLPPLPDIDHPEDLPHLAALG